MSLGKRMKERAIEKTFRDVVTVIATKEPKFSMRERTNAILDVRTRTVRLTKRTSE